MGGLGRLNRGRVCTCVLAEGPFATGLGHDEHAVDSTVVMREKTTKASSASFRLTTNPCFEASSQSERMTTNASASHSKLANP
jgi:hypothetical protein